MWSDVREIRCYKLDLLCYDEVCLGFALEQDWIEVYESDDGFGGLTEQMQLFFPAIPEGWFCKVAFPPFETCEAVLYCRG